MARDPSVPLTDIQWVMGHAHLSTTEVYLNPQLQDVIETMLAFYAKRPGPPAPATAGYRQESLDALFGKVREVTGTKVTEAVTQPSAPAGRSELLVRFPPRPAQSSWPHTQLPARRW